MNHYWPDSPRSPRTPDEYEPSPLDEEEAAVEAEDIYLNWLNGGRDQ